MRNILITGVGGQGIVLSSKILAQCAVYRGETARAAETIGMAQRGGSVTSHVRVGNGACSPLIPKGGAELILAFEPAEAARYLPYLAAGGAMVVSTRAVQPSFGSPYDVAAVLDFLRARLGTALTELDTRALFELCGSYKPLNIAMLGAAAQSNRLGVTREEIENAMRRLLPERLIPLNLRALAFGAGDDKEGARL